MVGRSRGQFLTYLRDLLEAKTALVLAVNKYSDLLTEFIDWSAPERELQTDVEPLLREMYLEL